MIRIPLVAYHNNQTLIVVELDEEQRLVNVMIGGETTEEDGIDRYLSPGEARELAAMLNHFASEAERPR